MSGSTLYRRLELAPNKPTKEGTDEGTKERTNEVGKPGQLWPSLVASGRSINVADGRAVGRALGVATTDGIKSNVSRSKVKMFRVQISKTHS